MELNQRLNILKDAGQIDDEVCKNILNIMKMFKDKWDIELNEENSAMLITHMAMALQRIKNKGTVEKMDKVIYEQILIDDNYNNALNLLKDIENCISIKINDEEKSFILLHLCTLFNNL